MSDEDRRKNAVVAIDSEAVVHKYMSSNLKLPGTSLL